MVVLFVAEYTDVILLYCLVRVFLWQGYVLFREYTVQTTLAFTTVVANLSFPILIIFQDLTDTLLKGVQFTQFCSEKMMAGTPLGEAFK